MRKHDLLGLQAVAQCNGLTPRQHHAIHGNLCAAIQRCMKPVFQAWHISRPLAHQDDAGAL
nr:hypothetical protein [Candidatus Dactylopiibacterium carminicum]